MEMLEGAEDFDIDADSVEAGTVMVQLQPWKPQQGDNDNPATTITMEIALCRRWIAALRALRRLSVCRFLLCV
jgi:hypothetical protein